MLTRLLASVFSPAGRRAALSILIFHRVLPVCDPLFPEEPDRKRFDEILGWLAGSFNVISLDRAVRDLEAGCLPARAVAITFDDGYEDNFSVALPLLQKHGLNATFFVSSGFLDGGRMWNDTIVESIRRFSGDVIDLGAIGLGQFPAREWREKRQAINALLPRLKYLSPEERLAQANALARICTADLPDDLMMSSEQVRGLRAAGMVVGAHTLNHPILAQVEEAVARNEIEGSKVQLEAILSEPVSLFAYPNGKPGRDYTGIHARMVREAGFTAAVSTSIGAARSATDLMQLPRFTPWDRSELRFGLRLVDNMRKEGKTI